MCGQQSKDLDVYTIYNTKKLALLFYVEFLAQTKTMYYYSAYSTTYKLSVTCSLK